jgi:hypothetical protein
MNNLVIEKTKTSPTVNLNAVNGNCSIIGSSYPENASYFYTPVFDWLNKYITEVTGELTFDFKLDYLNSSSIKFVSELVEKLNKYNKIGVSVVINWRYADADDDIKELGEEFQNEVECKFNLIEES